MIQLTTAQQSLLSHSLAATVAKGMMDQQSEGWATLRDLSGRKNFGTVEKFILTELVPNKVLANSAKGTWWRFTAFSAAWAKAALEHAEQDKNKPLTHTEQVQ